MNTFKPWTGKQLGSIPYTVQAWFTHAEWVVAGTIYANQQRAGAGVQS